MKGRFLIQAHEPSKEINIYADKSALVLAWLLNLREENTEFSLREVSNAIGISVGLVQKVFGALILKGVLQTQGIRTAKRFFFKKHNLLLKSWLDHYSIVKKCKMRTYRSSFQNRHELLEILKKNPLTSNVVLALHSAAEAHGYKNTNLNTLELYLCDPTICTQIEKILQLEPQERGYEVLLIEPYYKSWLSLNTQTENNLRVAPILLTFLDLYHFPLRGQEQAIFMAQHIPFLKRMYKE